MQEQQKISGGINVLVTVVTAYMSCTYFEKYTQIVTSFKVSPQFIYILKSASNLNGNLNCSKELEHYAS